VKYSLLYKSNQWLRCRLTWRSQVKARSAGRSHNPTRAALHGDSLSIIGKPVFGRQLPRFAAGCAQRSSRAGGPGHVLRPTLAGQRFRFAGVAPSSPSVRAQVEATANRACARAPGHLPRHPGRMQRRGTPAQMHRAVVVPPGAGPIRGRLPWLQGAAVLMRLSIAVCDGRPRAWAGERGRRRRPAATTSAC
jgi:hypothetical protein